MKTIEICKRDAIAFTDGDKRRALSDIQAKVKSRKIRFFGDQPISPMYHQGYLNYLTVAWNNHYGVFMRPDDIWYIILNELTTLIGKTPKAFANLFTTTPDKKQEIIVLTDNVETIDPELVIAKLKDRVPSNVDDFLPRFSTTTEMSQLAMNVAFCDLVSPYYSYGTMLCGIPRVTIDGTEDDWKQIISKLGALSELFVDNTKSYLQRCTNLVEQIIKAANKNDGSYFDSMVSLRHCGSGHQQEMSGWILGFLMDTKQGTQLEGLPAQMAKMHYKNLETQREFNLYCGLFYSAIKDGNMIPEYSAVRVESKPMKAEGEEWDHIVQYAEGSIVIHYGKKYKAKKESCGVYPSTYDYSKDTWECLNPNDPEKHEFKIISAPVTSKRGKLKAKWTEDTQQGLVYAPYIPKVAKTIVVLPDFVAKVTVDKTPKK
jgi:hypothetical protein